MVRTSLEMDGDTSSPPPEPQVPPIKWVCARNLIICVNQMEENYQQCVEDTGNIPFCESQRTLELQDCIDGYEKCRKENPP